MHNFVRFSCLITTLFLLPFIINADNLINLESSDVGHRLDITNIKIIKRKAKSVQFYADVVNTGRFDIQMGEGKRLPYLEIGFDESLEENNLTEHRSAIRKTLLSKNMRIRIGETKEQVFLKVKFEKKELRTPSYSIIPPVEKKSVSEKKPRLEKKKKGRSKPDKKKVKINNEGSFLPPQFKKKSLDDIIAEKEACPDLIIESIRVINSNSKKATIEYVLKNVGKGPAELYDHSDKKDSPLGVRAYISGSSTLSKGSFPIDGNLIESGLGTIRGILHPEESLTITKELDIRRKTRYMQVIILSADSFLKLRECDRTNNTNHIVLD